MLLDNPKNETSSSGQNEANKKVGETMRKIFENEPNIVLNALSTFFILLPEIRFDEKKQ